MAKESYFPYSLLKSLNIGPASEDAKRLALRPEDEQVSSLEITGFQKQVMFNVFGDFLNTDHRTMEEVEGELPFYEQEQMEAIRAIMPKLAKDIGFTPNEETSPITLMRLGLSDMVSLDSLEKLFNKAKKVESEIGDDGIEKKIARSLMKRAEYFANRKKKEMGQGES